MKKVITGILLALVVSTANAFTIPDKPGGVPSRIASPTSATTGFVMGYMLGTVITAVAEQNQYTCTTVKTAPLAGTNYTNHKSVCVK